MKTALVFFRPSEKEFSYKFYDNVESVLKNGGITADTIVVLSDNDDIGFKRNLLEFKDTVDNLLIIGGETPRFNLKEIIAEITETVLVENDNAKSFLDAVKNLSNEEYPDEYAVIPLEATVVPNILGGYQGFILSENNFSLTVLPNELEQLKPMCEKYVIPYVESKYGVKSKRLTLKYFGDKNLLSTTIEQVAQIYENAFYCNVKEKHGDYTIDLMFKNGDSELSKQVIRYIVGELKDGIYAEFDTTLSQRLFDLLKLKNLKLSVAESFTGGRIVSSIISNSGASQFVQEGIVSYSNDSKYKRLGVVSTDLKRDGAVSSVVAYQMALGLLKTGDCNVAISTTGIAGPKSDDTNKPVGLCYIGVGMKDGVHTYRYTLTGDREEITETAKNTALFLAIKKLKNI